MPVKAVLPGSQFSWGTVWVLVGVIAMLTVGLIAWQSRPSHELPNLQDLTDVMAPHRRAWYALPLVALTFSVLSLVLFPVLLLIAATGVAFGPWLGPIYAMVGSLTSASVGFAIGRRLGRKRVERFGGRRVIKISHTLRRHGTLAVFFLRKIPAPFTLTNIIIGASHVRYRDFLAGTFLGMIALVIALAGFGYQLSSAFSDPTPRKLAIAVLCLAVPLTAAWAISKRATRAVSAP